jgi:hypothetical protein
MLSFTIFSYIYTYLEISIIVIKAIKPKRLKLILEKISV